VTASLPVALARIDVAAELNRRYPGGLPGRESLTSVAWLSHRQGMRRLYRDAQSLHTARRTGWCDGVHPVTVEDLAPVELDADTAALHTWSHVEAVPRGPKDLHDIPASAFPRAGDPAPVALTPRVSSRHDARTSTGGAPPT